MAVKKSAEPKTPEPEVVDTVDEAVALIEAKNTALTAQVEALTADKARLIAEVERLARDLAARNEALAEAEDKLTEYVLGAKTPAAPPVPPAPPAPPAPVEVGVGTIGSSCGVLLLGDPKVLDGNWVSQGGGRRGFIVELTGGTDAEMAKLAKSSGFPFEKTDYGYRIDAVQQPSAAKVADDIARWAKQQERPSVKASVWSTVSTEYLARRATVNPAKAGPFAHGFGIALTQGRVTVSETPAGGKVYHIYAQ